MARLRFSLGATGRSLDRSVAYGGYYHPIAIVCIPTAVADSGCTMHTLHRAHPGSGGLLHAVQAAGVCMTDALRRQTILLVARAHTADARPQETQHWPRASGGC